MAQQINLLNPALLPRREVLTPKLMVLVLGFAVVGMAILYGHERYRLNALAQQEAKISAELEATKRAMLEISKQYAPREPSPALAQEVAAMEARLLSHENVLKAMKYDPAALTPGFSPYLRAFAHQGVKGLWLTGLRIDAADGGMVIRGRALAPELVPRYIALLGNEPALKGQKFSAMEMALPQRGTVPTDVSAKAALPYVEFVLQSKVDADAGGRRS